MRPRRGRGGGEAAAAVKKGPWAAEEDEVLRQHVREHGPNNWSSIQSNGLLPRTGKSCRLRWVNKLRPNLKTGCKFSPEEESVVIRLQAEVGNKWAKIATHLTGRTDNDVKNFWSTRQKRLARMQRHPQHAASRRRSTKRTATPTASASASASAPSQAQGLQLSPMPLSQVPGSEDIGQSSQEPSTLNQCADAVLSPVGLVSMDLAERSPSGGAATMTTGHLQLGADPPAAFVAELQDGVADMEPLAVLPPALDDDVAYTESESLAALPPASPQEDVVPVSGLDDYYGWHGCPSMPTVTFDDLPPEVLHFFDLPAPPSN
ncbi:hypothetical protein ACP4OV_017962 [Aristida adscensionis]